MNDLLREANRTVISELVKQQDNDILFDMWYMEQVELGKAYSDSEKPDRRVLRFIFDILISCGQENSHTIWQFFHQGYCYHFAVLLKEAFPGGYLVWAKPYAHICYMYQDFPYDIEGLYAGAGELVDVWNLGDVIESYRHRGRDDDLLHEMEEFAEQRDIEFEDLCKIIYDLVPTEERFITHIQTAMQNFRRYKDKI